MANDNGDKKEPKYCPYLDRACIEGECALYSEMMRSTSGLIEKFGMCAISSMVLILSELNAKTQSPKPMIEFSKGFR
uniref:Uncharacterized protein n=1 Tax=viral metagenome TaxID=1070528 RepID=A0A6M3IRD7_9ZZZZ